MPPRSTPSAAVSLTLALLLSLAYFAPTHVLAWCRASDESGPEGECVPKPHAPFLFWKRACTAYRFNEDLFDQLAPLTEKQIRSSFDAAFDAWAAVDCNGRGGLLIEQLAGTTSVAKSEYLRDAANEMVIIALDRAAWASLPDHSPRALALTLMWHNRKTGEILDADMELNLGASTFADCVATSCSANTVDLQNTITHEAGHVLGLGHSTDTGATMAAQTVGAVDTQKRSLAPDDSAGYCALELPEWQCRSSACSCDDAEPDTVTPRLRDTAGCAVSAPGAFDTSWIWLASALAIWCVRRRRRL